MAVNSFPDVSFVMVVYGVNTFRAAGEFLAGILQLATGGKNWKHGRVLSFYPVV